MKNVMIKMLMVAGIVSVSFFGGQMKAEAFENGATLNVESNVSNEAHLDGNLLNSGSSVGLGLNLKGSIDLSGEEENEIKSSHSEDTSDSMNKTVESESELDTKSELDTNSELNSNSSGQVSSSDLNSESSGSANLELDVEANSKTDLSLVQKTKLWFMGLIHSIFGESSTEVGTSTQVEAKSSIQGENESFSTKVNQQAKTENSLGLQSMFSLLFR